MLFILLVAGLGACGKTKDSMVIVRDCTGTYLRYQKKDYHVCNPEKLQIYPDGEPMLVSKR